MGNTEFIIENGVLVDYTGPGGDVAIPEGITAIGPDTFTDCSGLRSVVIPAGVARIGDSTFEGCSDLVDVTIPDSVRTIGNYAFSSCYRLMGISIPVGVKSIGMGAFHYCTDLQHITIPLGVESIGDEADGNDVPPSASTGFAGDGADGAGTDENSDANGAANMKDNGAKAPRGRPEALRPEPPFRRQRTVRGLLRRLRRRILPAGHQG